jgi:uncharacterized lipoprotein YddW (UPF0748 family)
MASLCNRTNWLSNAVLVTGLLVQLQACMAKPVGSNNDSFATETIRGVWLTNIASQALYSRNNIREAVALCSELGFNTIFVVTWNRSYTLYPSAVLKAVTGKTIDPDFEGRDPLQELIEEAREKKIKIHAWFEFGFASSYKDETGGAILQRKPEWASRDINGNITEKNGFQWMNAFHPEVQGFVKSLVLEVVKKYDVAGIQGDDRLPALPSNGGYDAYTSSLYKQEHNGTPPPQNEKDYEWIKWRSQRLNLFLKDMVSEVKALKPHLIISMAPSIYPWSEENYLQDWPTWLSMGLVDVIIPQIYRYEFAAYQKEFDKILNGQLGKFEKSRFYPGILLQVDDYTAGEGMLAQVLDHNRKNGVQGEVFFFYEGIKKNKAFFKARYKERKRK